MPKPIGPEQELINLSKDKWRWMAECDVKPLDTLFHDEAVFVHMGGGYVQEART